ncbi:GNAT family N-acetyltransferase [Microbacterium sp. cx-55]|uniref:GNAT family N-acetyltransferase n=1 Tax=Microbacterium sp. cx-55 TaxID=2875948 RepID=UPI001CBF6185|nr:GNAT family N-acetyltransferase [Microbacterium sp. cx-55]MBZ4488505.1 GNAT family N-acetyltransferase [Microbacterium sp. cx-55]UGB36091.1 GNAT family N-acetyltransferase [Microbacterium sp. cx-55]
MSSDLYFFTADPADLDRDLVHRWLSEQAYWALGRPREMQDAAMDASRNYGVRRRDTGAQVAFARIVTDNATFAWLCDVFVDPAVRGNGVGKMLVRGALADIEPLHLRRTLLATADAHGLYAANGFTALAAPDRMMERPIGH